MNNQKVCFICCTNDSGYEKECRLYLEHLVVPDGIQMEIKMVCGAASMAEGYHRAMKESDARYKVYLHQDVFILNENFISDILHLFEDEQIGMIGVVGGIGLPENGITYSAWNCGRLKTSDSYAAFEITGKIPEEEGGLVVEAVDGCLMATQYDLPWREDLFDGWDFYDVSQAMEFRKAGYLVKLPKQEYSWCFHDSGNQNLVRYEQDRKIFVREYGTYLTGENLEAQVEFYPEQWNLTQEIKVQLIQLFENGEYAGIYAFLLENYQKLSRDTELSVLRNLMELWYEEQAGGIENGFLRPGMTWEAAWNQYQQQKFWLYEMESGVGSGEEHIIAEIRENTISAEALVKLISHITLEKKAMLECLALVYQDMGNLRVAEIFRQMAATLE